MIGLRTMMAALWGVASMGLCAAPSFAQVGTIDIPAQDLRAALDEFIVRTNVQLVYRVDDLQGLRSHAVRGETDVNAALASLLEGSGIDYRRDPSGAIVVSRNMQAAQPRGDGAAANSPRERYAEDDLETVTVTGFRASLGQVLQLKRSFVGSRDSILAEDIGKYPASNIAESLLRVPGVVIARDMRTDEGKSVTVRGLPSAYTIVTINGNPVHMETGGDVGFNARSVDLDALGPDLFSRVDFYKSPRASLDEGGIGGVIDLRTPHPFDYDGRKIGYSFGYGLNSNRDKGVPAATFLASNTWGPVGALLAVTAKRSSYAFFGNETAGVSQACNENGYLPNSEKYDFGPGRTAACGPVSWAGVDPRANIGRYTIDQINQAFIPRWGRVRLTLDDRMRYSGLLSLQFKPGDTFEISFDLVSSWLSDAANDYTMGTFFRGTGSTTAAGIAAAANDPTKLGKTSATNGLVPLDIHIDPNDNLYGSFGNVQLQSGNVWYRSKDKFLSGTLKAKYQPTDLITLVGEAGISSYNGFIAQDSLAAYIFNTTLTYDPTANYKFPALISSVDVTDSTLFQGNSTGTRAGFDTAAQYWKEGDRVLIGRMAAHLGFDTGVASFDHVEAELGLSWVGNTKTNDQRNNANLVKATSLSNGATLATMLPSASMVNHIKVTNFLGGVSHPPTFSQWATVPDTVFYMVPWTTVLAGDTSGNWYPSVFKLTEGVASIYANVSTAGRVLGKTLRLDAGVRYAVTRTWGYNFASQKDSSGTISYPKVRIHGSYDSILPSVALSLDLTDEVVARAAYGQTITRADLGSIAKGASVPSIYNPNVSLGNPDLKPFTATNIDLGIEWYFDTQAVVSAGVFYKGVKNLISTVTVNDVPWGSLDLPDSLLASNQHINNDSTQPVDPNYLMSVTRPVNLNPMVVKGVEVFYQRPFTFLPEPFDGLGAIASFTYTAGAQGGPGTGFVANDGTIYRMQLKGLSTYSYSATGYYEKNGVSLRISYSWRSKTPSDDSLANLNYFQTNTRLWTKARGSLDLTAGYSVSDWAELRFDVSNLLNEQDIVVLVDGTGTNTLIGARAAPFGNPNAHVYSDWVHGRNYMISIRGRL